MSMVFAVARSHVYVRGLHCIRGPYLVMALLQQGILVVVCAGEQGWWLRWWDDILVLRLVVSRVKSKDSGEALSFPEKEPEGAPSGL